MDPALKAIIYSFLEKYGSLIIQTISTVIIARLITPHDLGVFSIGMAFIAIAHTIRDFGISTYIIQAKNLTKNEIHICFTIACLVATTISLAIYFCRHFVAEFYHEDGLNDLMSLFAITFMLLPLGAIPQAILRRNMLFSAIFSANITGSFTQAIVSILLTYNGYGYIGLGLGGLASSVMTILVNLIYISPNSFFIFKIKGGREVLASSTKFSIISIISEIGGNLPDMVIGKVINIYAAGIYSRGIGLARLFNLGFMNAVFPVLLPYFSEKNRAGHNIGQIFIHTFSCLLVLAWPFFLWLTLASHDVIQILYGDSWINAVPIAQILNLGMAFRCLSAICSTFLTATNHVNQLLRIKLYIEMARVAFIFAAAAHGLEAIGWAFSVSEILSFLFHVSAVKRTAKIGYLRYVRPVAQSVIVMAAVFVSDAILSLCPYCTQFNQVLHILGSASAALLAWLFLLWIIKHPILLEASNRLIHKKI